MNTYVLIGTGDERLAAELRSQLAELSETEVVGVEKTSAAVLGIVTTHQDLDVVLADEEMGPQPAQDVVREIAMRRPHVASILLSARVDEEVLSRALEAGARGVLPKRPNLGELDSRLAAAAEWSHDMRGRLGAGLALESGGRQGRIVAVAGAKGGTGATILAVQLALAAAVSRSVCLVDMDLQSGDIPSYLDLVHRRSIVDLVPVAHEITGQVLADALFVHRAGPHILLGPQEGERAEDVSSLSARQILGALRTRYEVVVVDCGSHMTEGSVTAVEIADRALLVVMPELPCLRAAKRVANLWKRLRVRKEDEITALLTRQSRRNEIQPDFAARILGLPVARTTIPPANRAMERAINNGALLRVDDDGFRRAITQLGTEIGIVATGAEARSAAWLRGKVGTA